MARENIGECRIRNSQTGRVFLPKKRIREGKILLHGFHGFARIEHGMGIERELLFDTGLGGGFGVDGFQ